MDLMYTAHVPAGEGPFPTIIALHGWGASAHDLFGLAPYLHGGQALVVCPQGPVRFQTGPGTEGYGWFPITGGGSLDPAEFTKGRLLLRDFVERIFEIFPVDRRKVVVMGFSQGGVMAYDLALRDPLSFAGLVAMSAWLPNDLANQIEVKDEHAALPVIVTHGTNDPMIPVERARASRDRLIGMGISPTYREYEMQHEIHQDALRDIVDWIEEKALNVIQLA